MKISISAPSTTHHRCRRALKQSLSPRPPKAKRTQLCQLAPDNNAVTKLTVTALLFTKAAGWPLSSLLNARGGGDLILSGALGEVPRSAAASGAQAAVVLGNPSSEGIKAPTMQHRVFSPRQPHISYLAATGPHPALRSHKAAFYRCVFVIGQLTAMCLCDSAGVHTSIERQKRMSTANSLRGERAPTASPLARLPGRGVV